MKFALVQQNLTIYHDHHLVSTFHKRKEKKSWNFLALSNWLKNKIINFFYFLQIIIFLLWVFSLFLWILTIVFLIRTVISKPGSPNTLQPKHTQAYTYSNLISQTERSDPFSVSLKMRGKKSSYCCMLSFRPWTVLSLATCSSCSKPCLKMYSIEIGINYLQGFLNFISLFCLFIYLFLFILFFSSFFVVSRDRMHSWVLHLFI